MTRTRGAIQGVPRAIAMLLAVLAMPVTAAARLSPLGFGPYVPGEVLVTFKATASAGERRAAVTSHGHVKIADLAARSARVALAPREAVEAAVAAYRGDGTVESAQPNFVYHVSVEPNDPQYGQLWAFKNTGQRVTSVVQGGASLYPTNNPGTPGDDIDIEKAWDHVTDCSAVVVAVVDSGVSYGQQDLAANMWDGGAEHPLHGYDFVDGDADPMDWNGHGTHVAGIIGASGNGATGTTGVCWKASLMAVRVMDAAGEGTTATIIQGIDFAVSHGAQVINMSLGGGSYDPLFSDAITSAWGAGAVVVVAAGNEGTDNDAVPTYPCSFTQPNLVCVAALDQDYQLATFSNYGATTVDVGAPGTNILSTWAGTSTSISDPLVSGWTGTTTSGGRWAYTTNRGYPYLVDPADYPNGLYARYADDRVRKSFSTAGADAAVLRFGAAVNVRSGDYFRVACSTDGSDPFSSTGTVVGQATGIATFPKVLPATVDVSTCIGPTSSVGFQLWSGGGATDLGVAITGVTVETLVFDTTSYNTASGTSMAAPMVAGLAAMLRAYNPQYTSADVVTAIQDGGRPVSTLAGKTATGKAIDVMGSLAYLHAPTGLTAIVR